MRKLTALFSAQGAGQTPGLLKRCLFVRRIALPEDSECDNAGYGPGGSPAHSYPPNRIAQRRASKAHAKQQRAQPAKAPYRKPRVSLGPEQILLTVLLLNTTAFQTR